MHRYNISLMGDDTALLLIMMYAGFLLACIFVAYTVSAFI